jgi:hypothetical protein
MMKKFMYLWCVFALFGLVACSDEDDEPVQIKAPTDLDASLLPGYWLLVKDDTKQNTGIWISDKEDIVASVMGKPVTFFYLPNGLEAPAKRTESSFWVVKNGVISIWMWEGERTILKLSKDRMTMMTTSYIDDASSVIQEYERLADPIVIEE